MSDHHSDDVRPPKMLKEGEAQHEKKEVRGRAERLEALDLTGITPLCMA